MGDGRRESHKTAWPHCLFFRSQVLVQKADFERRKHKIEHGKLGDEYRGIGFHEEHKNHEEAEIDKDFDGVGGHKTFHERFGIFLSSTQQENMNDAGHCCENGEADPSFRMRVLRINILIIKPETRTGDEEKTNVDEKEAEDRVHRAKDRANLKGL